MIFYERIILCYSYDKLIHLHRSFSDRYLNSVIPTIKIRLKMWQEDLNSNWILILIQYSTCECQNNFIISTLHLFLLICNKITNSLYQRHGRSCKIKLFSKTFWWWKFSLPSLLSSLLVYTWILWILGAEQKLTWSNHILR